MVAALAVTALWLAVVTRKALAAGRLRASSGREALGGRMGVGAQLDRDRRAGLVDGALWRARRSLVDDDEGGSARATRSSSSASAA